MKHQFKCRGILPDMKLRPIFRSAAFLVFIGSILTAGGCNKRNSESAQGYIRALRTAEAAGNRSAMEANLVELQRKGVLTEEEADLRSRLQLATQHLANIEGLVRAGKRSEVADCYAKVRSLRLPLASEEQSLLERATLGVAIESELELARAKSDIDGLFLSLTKLHKNSFMAPSEAELLNRCENALKSIQELRVSLANHDHESVVDIADQILDAFPDNVEARRAFRESGLIFGHLEAALDAFATIAKTTSETNDEEYQSLINNLSVAEQRLGEALKLDPLYAQSIALRKYVSSTQSVVAGILLEALGKESAQVFAASEKVSIDTYNEVNNAFKAASRIAPWDIYRARGHAARIEGFYEKVRPIVDDLRKRSLLLEKLRNDGNAKAVDATIRMVDNLPSIVRGLINPTGSWIDFSNSIRESQKIMGECSATYRLSYTDFSITFKDCLLRLTEARNIVPYSEPAKIKPILQKRRALLI